MILPGIARPVIVENFRGRAVIVAWFFIIMSVTNSNSRLCLISYYDVANRPYTEKYLYFASVRFG
jgi:hypothetical protein